MLHQFVSEGIVKDSVESPTKCIMRCSLLLQTSLLWSRRPGILPLKTELKKASSTLAFSMSFVTGIPTAVMSWPTFPLLFLLLLIDLQILHAALYLPYLFQLQVGFGFPDPIPSQSDHVSVFLLGFLLLLPNLLYFFYALEFCQELHYLFVRMDHS